MQDLGLEPRIRSTKPHARQHGRFLKLGPTISFEDQPLTPNATLKTFNPELEASPRSLTFKALNPQHEILPPVGTSFMYARV